MRKVERQIKIITAGNSAIYAIRKSDYIGVDPIRYHDSAMPLEAALNDKRALYNDIMRKLWPMKWPVKRLKMSIKEK